MAGYLEDNGYEVRLFNLLDMDHSDAWNCLVGAEGDSDRVQSIAQIIINNTSDSSDKDDFWAKAELNLLTALIHFVVCRQNIDTGELLLVHERGLGAVYNLLSATSFQGLDELMMTLPEGHPAIRPYGIFKLANRQIWGNIAIGLGNRLSVFQNPLVDKITAYDEIDSTLPGRKPCAYFCAISDQESSKEFLSSLFFSELFTRLMEFAKRPENGGHLPVTVNVCLEEFCNIGKLVDFKKVLSVCRSRGIFCQQIVQSISQLSDLYQRKEWDELIGNCDIQIALGCNDQMTAKYLSEKCGNVTIGVTNNQFPLMPLFSPVYSSTRPYSQTRSNTQRALMQPDEILHMDNRQCLVFLRGQKPMLLYKIIPEEFEAFKYLRKTPVHEHTPQWRKAEAVRSTKAQQATSQRQRSPFPLPREIISPIIKAHHPSAEPNNKSPSIPKNAEYSPAPAGAKPTVGIEEVKE